MGTPWVVLAPLCRVVHCRQRMRSCGSVINDCQVFEEKILANTDIKMQIMTIWHEKYYNKTARRHQSAAVCVNNCVIIWTQTPASFIWLDKHHPSQFQDIIPRCVQTSCSKLIIIYLRLIIRQFLQLLPTLLHTIHWFLDRFSQSQRRPLLSH